MELEKSGCDSKDMADATVDGDDVKQVIFTYKELVECYGDDDFSASGFETYAEVIRYDADDY